jgi:hypothetical protein
MLVFIGLMRPELDKVYVKEAEVESLRHLLAEMKKDPRPSDVPTILNALARHVR